MKAVLTIGLLFISLLGFAQAGRTGYTTQDQLTDQYNKLTALSTTPVTITTGASTTLAATPTNVWVLVNPATTLAAHAITLPARPVHGQTVNVSFGGTITSGAVVTALTINPNTGSAILQSSAPGSGQAGGTIAYRYSVRTAKWYRLY